MSAAVVILGLAAVLSPAEAVPPPQYCSYPYEFYPDGEEPNLACCKSCGCFCPRSKTYFWTQGGKCWARCNCFGDCKPITPPEPTCDYPWKFYPDGSEPPPEICCLACSCKCRTSKPHPLGDLAGGKCWARCTGCGFQVCDAIWFYSHFYYILWYFQVKTVKYI